MTSLNNYNLKLTTLKSRYAHLSTQLVQASRESLIESIVNQMHTNEQEQALVESNMAMMASQ